MIESSVARRAAAPGEVGGVGARSWGLMEASPLAAMYGRIMNPDLQHNHVPVNTADKRL